MIKTGFLLILLLSTNGAWGVTPKEIDCTELLTVLLESVEEGLIKEQEAHKIYKSCLVLE